MGEPRRVIIVSRLGPCRAACNTFVASRQIGETSDDITPYVENLKKFALPANKQARPRI